MRVLVLICALSALAPPAFAQPFANARASLANYSVASVPPQKACEGLSSLTSDGVVSIQARIVQATAAAPQHCRVTGLIAPEIAFEVNLPDLWNQRFYMSGNGGLAGQPIDIPDSADRAAALTNGFVHARTDTGHDSRKGRGSIRPGSAWARFGTRRRLARRRSLRPSWRWSRRRSWRSATRWTA